MILAFTLGFAIGGLVMFFSVAADEKDQKKEDNTDGN